MLINKIKGYAKGTSVPAVVDAAQLLEEAAAAGLAPTQWEEAAAAAGSALTQLEAAAGLAPTQLEEAAAAGLAPNGPSAELPAGELLSSVVSEKQAPEPPKLPPKYARLGSYDSAGVWPCSSTG